MNISNGLWQFYNYMVFPSPTGVNHYEYYYFEYVDSIEYENEFPSPTGVNHYE